MEVIPLIRSSATGSEASNGDNSIKRRVQEWSRLDRLTGILEHARVEADQWTNHTANTKHKYGKVVDRRARNLADGSKEETQQTKQLEVFQAHTAGCSVQVIRSQTSTTSSWHNSSTGSSAAFQWPPSIFDKKDNQFDQLRLDYSPLDVSSQKSKASVGRSGSISTRRPPTRRPTQTVAVAQLPEVESDAEAAEVTTKTSSHAAGHEQHQRRGADATAAAAVAAAAVSTNLNRLKSCSSDEIRGENNHHRHHHHHNHNNNNNDNNDIVNNHIHNNNNNHNNESSDETSLDRSSRFRRSLQFAQLRRTTQDSQQHRISGGGELEDVLKKVLGKKLRAADGDDDDDADEVNGDGDGDDDWPLLIKPACPSKKPSFVTVECLKKTKNSLRHLNGVAAAAGEDDGIDADDAATTVAVPAAVVGDSRSLDYRGSALARTEEWYNRRKSYGFEKVHNTTASSSSSDGGKYAAATEPSSAMDSSTDSGICRSTENGLSNSSRQSSVDREPSIADLVKKYTVQKEINNNVNGHGNGNAAAYTTTVVAKGKILEAINSLRSKSSAYFDVVKPGDAVVSTASKENGEQVVRRLSVGIDLTADKSIVDKDDVPKRHSIAVVSDLADREPSADKKNANKKVEFCRTEVHFDATPGKINIVDMEDKPAPAQLYRPKKRYNRQSEKSHALPEYRFGDDVRSDIVLQMNGNDGNECTASSAEDDNNNKPRSILKRQQQQQQQQQQQLLQKNVENSGGVASDNGIEVRISSTESTPVDCRRASWSVADRVKQVEAVGFSTRVNFTEGETTAVGFDPADPGRPNRYSYNGTASPVWYQNNGNSPSTADGSAAKRCHEKLLVRIGGAASASAVTSSSSSSSTLSAAAAADLCAFSKRFSEAAEQRLSSTSLVMMNTARFRAGDQPSTYLEEMNTKMQGRLFQKAAASTSWPRCGHKTYPTTAACRKYNLLKSCADIRRERAAATASASADDDDVIGALDDLSKTIDAQIVDHRRRGGGGGGSHVTLIKVRQPAADEIINGRLEYAKDLMSTDETSEESLKADEEVRSYMMAASDDCTNDDDDDDDDDDCPKRPSDRQQPLECDNLKKLISTVEKKVNRTLQCSQADGSCGRAGKTDAKSYESALTVPNVTSVLLNHRDGPRPEPERSPFQPVSSVLAAQVANAAKRHRAEDGDDDAAARHKQQQQPAGSKRVPVKIVQDNRAKSTTTGNKPKTEVVAKTAADVSAAKSCAATVSLKQVPMTVQPKPASVEKKKPAEKKESIYGNVAGCRAAAGNGVAGHGNGPASNGPASNGPMNNGLVSNGSLRAKDRPSAAASRPAQDLFSTGRDSWLNMPKDLGPKLNRSKAAPAAYAKGPRGGRREPAGAASTAPGPADSDLSVLEQLNRAADEILKAVDGYTDDEQQQQQQQQQRPQQQRPQQQQKQRRRADDAAADTSSSSEAKLKNKKKAARLLQRANSREALLQLDGASSSDEDAAALDEQPHCRVKPKTQRKTRQQQQQQQHDNLGVAAKTTASFTKKIQSRVQNVTKTNVQHKVHPTYYGNVSSCTQTSSMRFRNKPSDCLTKQAVDQKDVKSSRYQCKITTTRTFNSKKVKGSAEESNKNSIKGC